MRDLPTHFERAGRLAAERSQIETDAGRVDGLRRALREVRHQQMPLFSKALVDDELDTFERTTLEEAVSRLSRYYGYALTLEDAEELEPALEALRSSAVEQARALELAMQGEKEPARAAYRRSQELLETVEPSAEPGDPKLVHSAADVVYDRATGQSKYDADAEGWLTFALRCPSESCFSVKPYRLLSRHPTHRFECSACKAPFVVFLATVLFAEKEARHISATHKVRARAADGSEHQIEFEHLFEQGGDVTIEPEDLVLFTYDVTGKLRIVRDYTLGRELVVRANGRCFVATAVSGAHAPEVALLQTFRDRVLRRSRGGRAFILAYERVGPHLADLTLRSPAAHRAARRLVLLAARLVKRHTTVN